MEGLLLECDVDSDDYIEIDYIEIESDDNLGVSLEVFEGDERCQIVLKRAKAEQLAAWLIDWLKFAQQQTA